jgi:transposase
MARTAHTDITTPSPLPALYVALELSKNTWKLGFTTSRTQRARIRDVPARDKTQFLAEVAAAKQRFGLPPDTPTRSCYEAGRDGFWIHRFLDGNGIDNVILEPASIEVNRRAKRAKTDRLDVQKLAQLLVRHHDGEEGVVRIVRVPPPDAEDERLLPRQLRRLKKTRARLTNAMRAALFRHGLDLNPRSRGYLEELAAARQWDGQPLPPGLLQELELHWQQFVLVDRQVKDLSRQQRAALRDVRRGTIEGTVAQQKAARLTELRGIGDTGAYVLSTEFFAWREFNNRGEVGALAGLTGTPFSSGSENRDQGISKAGNARVRTLMVELAWCWLRFQPDSRTSRWFHEHVGKGGSRSKRKAIVAVARKLLVELWHYVEHGVVPDGAQFKPEASTARSAA